MRQAAARTYLPRGAVALGLLLIALGTCAGSFRQAYYRNDIESQNLPERSFIGRGLRAGEMRWWCTEAGGGFPLVAEGQAGALYPGNLLFATSMPAWLAYSWTVVLHIWWAGLGVAALLRRYGTGRVAAFAGGVTYMLSAPVFFRIVHINILQGVAWLPWMVWGVELGVTGASVGFIVTALGFASQLVTFHIHPPLLSVFFLPCYAAARTVMVHRPGWRTFLGVAGTLLAMLLLLAAALRSLGLGWLLLGGLAAGWYCLRLLAAAPGGVATVRALGGTLAALGFGGLLAGAQLLTMLELVPYSERGAGRPLYWALDISLEPAQLACLLTAKLHGLRTAHVLGWGRAPHWEYCAHVGIFPLLLWLLSPLLGRRPERWFFLAIGVAGLLIAMGHVTPFYAWLISLPGMPSIRGPARLVGLFGFGVAITTGLVIDDLSRDPPAPRRRAPLAALLILAVLLTVGAATILTRDAAALAEESGPFVAAWVRAAILMIVAAALLVGRSMISPRRVGIWLGVVACVVAVDLVSGSRGYEPLFSPGYYEPTIEVSVARSRDARFFVSTYDWNPLRSNRHLLYDGIENFAIYTPLALNRWNRVDNVIRQALPRGNLAARRWVALARVRWAYEADLTTEELTAPGRLLQVPDLQIYPRAWLTPGWIVASSAEEAIGATLRPDWRPEDETILEAPAPPAASGGEAGVVAEAWYGRHRVRLAVSGRDPQVLVLSRTWFPGWWARVDGGEWVPTEPADYLLTGLKLGPGPHRVELVYRPLSIRFGLFASLIALGCLAAIGVMILPRRTE